MASREPMDEAQDSSSRPARSPSSFRSASDTESVRAGETQRALEVTLDAAPAALPYRLTLHGRYVTLVPLDAAAHADALWERAGGPDHDGLWRYLHSGPFPTRAAFVADLERKAVSDEQLFFAILDNLLGGATGFACYMRIEPRHRRIEVGSILYTPAFQRTRGATEAMYLLARHVFEDLGYRRYEWKCDVLNELSCRAAVRFGFTFEGIFRQHMIVKGRSRDTAWYAMLDTEWPERRAEFERWLDPSNFDAGGTQLTRLCMN